MVLDMRPEILRRPLPLDQRIRMQWVTIHESEPQQASAAHTPAVLFDPADPDLPVALHFRESVQEPLRVFRMPGLLFLPGDARL